MKKEFNTTEYVEELKKAGYSTSEIMYMVQVKLQGTTLTKAQHKFGELYNKGKIDGFPESSIKVLAMYYGEKNLKKMSRGLLISKVRSLQGCITDFVDMEIVEEDVDYFLQSLKD